MTLRYGACPVIKARLREQLQPHPLFHIAAETSLNELCDRSHNRSLYVSGMHTCNQLPNCFNVMLASPSSSQYWTNQASSHTCETRSHLGAYTKESPCRTPIYNDFSITRRAFCANLPGEALNFMRPRAHAVLAVILLGILPSAAVRSDLHRRHRWYP